MNRAKLRAYRIIFAALLIAAGVAVPFLSLRAGRDVLASAAVVGGLAILVASLLEYPDEGNPS